MPVPTHRADCKTIIYQTKCWDCGKPVWYFACSCGSLVLFNAKDPPWPQHKDTCSIYWIKQFIQEGRSIAGIRRIINEEARRLGKRVPIEVEQLLTRYEGGKEIVVDVLPTEEPILITGSIKKLDSVNFYKRFGFLVNPITTAVLGELAKESHVEITLQEAGPTSTGVVRRCTFYSPQRFIDPQKHRVGKTIIASLIFRDIVGGDNQAFWFAQKLEAVHAATAGRGV
jgi:hypothetical protein